MEENKKERMQETENNINSKLYAYTTRVDI